MRKVAYVLAIIVVLLAVVTLFRTNLLASDGQRLKELTVAHEKKQEELAELRRQVMEARSLSTVMRRAEEMGFGDAVELRVISSDL